MFQESSARLGGLSAFDVYIPILIAFSIGIIALVYLPGPLVSYRTGELVPYLHYW